MPSTSPRLPAAERIAQIAAAADEIARTEGLDAITLRAVAAHIGVAPALVAHYAPRMETVVADCFTAVTAGELAEVAGLARAVEDPVARLAAVLDTLLDDSRAAVTAVWVQSWTLGRRSELLADRVRASMDEWRAFLAGVVGDLPTTVGDPLAVAGQILGMIDGLNAHGLVGWNRAGQRELLARAVEGMVGLPPGGLGAR